MTRLIIPALVALLVSGCANTLTSHVSLEYKNKQTEIDSIALAGAGASLAASDFDELGYNLVDIGTGKDDPIDRAKNLGISYIAIVAPIDSEGSWWDGFFAFSMRITETVKRNAFKAAFNGSFHSLQRPVPSPKPWYRVSNF